MVASITMQAPGPNLSFTCRSGNTYRADAAGVISGVTGQDINDLMGDNCFPLGTPDAPALVTGRFYGVPTGVTPAALLTLASTLYAYPIYIPSECTVSTLGLSCTTGQTSGQGRVGIYSDNGLGYPGALNYDSGAMSLVSSSTLPTVTGVNTALKPGVYWLASIFTATGTYPSVAGTGVAYTNPIGGMTGYDTAAHALATSAQAISGISVAGTFGALPTSFTSGATLTLNAATPLVVMGV